MTKHKLKTIQPFFDAVWVGAKTFEVRSNHDRNFQPADILVLEEYDLKKGYSGRKIEAIVSYIMRGGQFGLAPGYVCMGIKIIQEGKIDAGSL